MNRTFATLLLLAASMIGGLSVAFGEKGNTVSSNITLAEAKELLRNHYEAVGQAGKNGDIAGSVAALTDDAHFSFDGNHFVGRETLASMYPKDFKDDTLRVSPINTVVQGDTIYDLVAVYGQAAGAGKAYLIFYTFQKRGDGLVITQFVSATVDAASLPN